MDYYQTGQSKVSYHPCKSKEVGLIREKRRGRWSFYCPDGEAVRHLLVEATNQLGKLAPGRSGR